jgi:hypothetical protein
VISFFHESGANALKATIKQTNKPSSVTVSKNLVVSQRQQQIQDVHNQLQM